MKKLLYLPLNVAGGASEQVDLAAAFRKVYEVETFDHLNSTNPNGGFIEAFTAFRPDIVHAQWSDKITPSIISGLQQDFPQTIWTQWSGDCREEPVPLIVEYGRYMDATLLASGDGQREHYEGETGSRVFWWQHAIADWQLLPHIPEKDKTGIVMVGNIYGQDQLRVALARRLTKEFADFVAYGDGYPDDVRRGGRIDWKEQSQVFNKAVITIGPNYLNYVDKYFSDRPLIAMAAGSCHMFEYVPGAEELFTDGYECIFWRTVDEAVEKIQNMLNNPIGRAWMAQAGQDKVRKYHSWDARVAEYQKIVESL